MIRVVGYNYKGHAIDTTSRSNTWSRGLSPFYLGPCDLANGYTSLNVENAWQYLKVYECHIKGGEVTEDYWTWAQVGWSNPRAVRYPMGKGAKPLFSLWDGERLSYIEARKRIYIPLYAMAVIKTEAFSTLKQVYKAEGSVTLKDFDGYDYLRAGKTLEEVAEDPNKKMGHAFVLAMMLDDS